MTQPLFIFTSLKQAWINIITILSDGKGEASHLGKTYDGQPLQLESNRSIEKSDINVATGISPKCLFLQFNFHHWNFNNCNLINIFYLGSVSVSCMETTGVWWWCGWCGCTRDVWGDIMDAVAAECAPWAAPYMAEWWAAAFTASWADGCEWGSTLTEEDIGRDEDMEWPLDIPSLCGLPSISRPVMPECGSIWKLKKISYLILQIYSRRYKSGFSFS